MNNLLKYFFIIHFENNDNYIAAKLTLQCFINNYNKDGIIYASTGDKITIAKKLHVNQTQLLSLLTNAPKFNKPLDECLEFYGLTNNKIYENLRKNQ